MGPGLYYDRTLVSTCIIVDGRPDCEVGLPRGTVNKAVSQRNDIGESIIKPVDRQSDVAGLLVFEAPVDEVVIGVSG